MQLKAIVSIFTNVRRQQISRVRVGRYCVEFVDINQTGRALVDVCYTLIVLLDYA